MNTNEKASKSVKIFDSTYALIDSHKGKRSAPVFIDDAVQFYLRAMDDGDPYAKIVKAIEQINERQTTNMGLLCEVLRQAGILNGNGEIKFVKQ